MKKDTGRKEGKGKGKNRRVRPDSTGTYSLIYEILYPTITCRTLLH
jgi:hypothetical protein